MGQPGLRGAARPGAGLECAPGHGGTLGEAAQGCSGPSRMSPGGSGCAPTLSPWPALICKAPLALQQLCSPQQLKPSLHDGLSMAADISGTCPALTRQGWTL